GHARPPRPTLFPYTTLFRSWSTGGETSLANLMLLCSKHHTLVHEGGFRIEKDYRDRWFFRRPDGRAVPACGYRAADMRDDGAAIDRKSTRLNSSHVKISYAV